MNGGKRRHGDDFDPHFAGTFVFRDPEEVFREFFDGMPFDDLFSGEIFAVRDEKHEKFTEAYESLSNYRNSRECFQCLVAVPEETPEEDTVTV